MSIEQVSDLIAMLAYRATHTPERLAFTFNQENFSYRALWQQVERYARVYQRRGVKPQDRAVILFPNGPEFFYVFYGLQRIGATPVPLVPVEDGERVFSIAQLAQANWIMLPGETDEAVLQKFTQMAGDKGLRLIRVGREEDGEQVEHVVRPEDIAFIQFTSGSTGQPKGVQISHDNLITNIRQMIAGMGITQAEIMVSWLPVYHDMGLILMTMTPFYLGFPTHLLPTSLTQTSVWIETLARLRATFTAAPDFAYRLMLKNLSSVDHYDLSSLRVALNAAEPVRAETLKAFHQTFGLQDVMVAGYGLAEVTVGVSMWKPGAPNRVDDRGFVSVGQPFPQVDVAIIEGETILPAGQVGEIAIRSAANTLGYYGEVAGNRNLAWGAGFILSGDLGYLDEDGYLYIVGRKKNIIKYIGRTVAPSEIEQIADAVEGVRYSAAIGVTRETIEGEQVYVLVEVRDAGMAEEQMHALVIEIVSAIYAQLGFRPARVYLLRPKAIPKTHNGKIQYQRLRELVLDEQYRAAMALYPHY